MLSLLQLWFLQGCGHGQRKKSMNNFLRQIASSLYRSFQDNQQVNTLVLRCFLIRCCWCIGILFIYFLFQQFRELRYYLYWLTYSFFGFSTLCLLWMKLSSFLLKFLGPLCFTTCLIIFIRIPNKVLTFTEWWAYGYSFLFLEENIYVLALNIFALRFYYTALRSLNFAFVPRMSFIF